MAENEKNILGNLEKLALVAEAMQSVFEGKTTIVCELGNKEYKDIISHFREIDRHHEQFSIDISGTEFHFILSEMDK